VNLERVSSRPQCPWRWQRCTAPSVRAWAPEIVFDEVLTLMKLGACVVPVGPEFGDALCSETGNRQT
jgi:hypothetical protein